MAPLVNRPVALVTPQFRAVPAPLPSSILIPRSSFSVQGSLSAHSFLGAEAIGPLPPAEVRHFPPGAAFPPPAVVCVAGELLMITKQTPPAEIC